VKSPDEDDDMKLSRVIQYIRDTQHITLTIESNNNPQWWVDSSYEVHPNMKGHTVKFISVGEGRKYTSSCKQKLNTKSSTKAELIAIDNADGPNTMDKEFTSSTRGKCTNNNNLPRQQKHKPTIRKWQDVK